MQISSEDCKISNSYDRDEMGRCHRAFTFRKSPENITQSVDVIDVSDHFDIIADSSRTSSNKKRQPEVPKNNFKWNNVQKMLLYNDVHTLDVDMPSEIASSRKQSRCSSTNRRKTIRTPKFASGVNRLTPEDLENLQKSLQNSVSEQGDRVEHPDNSGEITSDIEDSATLQINITDSSPLSLQKHGVPHLHTHDHSKYSTKHYDSLCYSNDSKTLNRGDSLNEIHIEISSDSDDDRKIKRNSSEQIPSIEKIPCVRETRKRLDTSQNMASTMPRSKFRPNTGAQQFQNLAEMSFYCSSEADTKYEGTLGSFKNFENPGFV